MRKEKDYLIIEKDEEIKGPNLHQRLSVYTQILSKENNIYIIIDDKQIPLKKAKSFFKICELSELYPEENIYFNFDDIGSVLSSQSKKLRIKSSRKKSGSENSEDENKKDESLTKIVDELKPSIKEELEKEGSLIASHHNIFNVTWKNLYLLLFILTLIITVGFLLIILPILNGKKFEIYQIPTIPLILLNFIVSLSGYSKTKLRNKKVNFKRENYLFVVIILNEILCLGLSFFPLFGKPKELFIFSSLLIEILILATMMLLAFILIGFNIQMVDFYKKYDEKLNSGTLLVDMK